MLKSNRGSADPRTTQWLSPRRAEALTSSLSTPLSCQSNITSYPHARSRSHAHHRANAFTLSSSDIRHILDCTTRSPAADGRQILQVQHRICAPLHQGTRAWRCPYDAALITGSNLRQCLADRKAPSRGSIFLNKSSQPALKTRQYHGIRDLILEDSRAG